MAKEQNKKDKQPEITGGNRFVGVPEEFEFVGLEEDVVVLSPDGEPEE